MVQTTNTNMPALVLQILSLSSCLCFYRYSYNHKI